MANCYWVAQRSFGTNTIQLLFYERRNEKMYRAAKMNLKMVEHDELTAIPEPTLELPSLMAQPFLQAMAEMLHQQNVKPQSQSFIEGELVATKAHLTDMRKLVFKETP